MPNKTIVLTGSSQGLGREMAYRFAESGHTVIGCGRSTSAQEELGAELGAPHRFDGVDVSRDGDVAEWAASVLDSHGAPDLLLNNAAIINANAPMWEVPGDEFSQVVDINIKGVANVIRHFVPAMIDRGSGVIVNFSSGWGRATSAEVAPYCATKWAIEGLSQAMAQELPGGMACIPLNPGIINTAMLQSCFGSSADHYPDAKAWSHRAAPFLLEIGPRDNGQPMTVPGH